MDPPAHWAAEVAALNASLQDSRKKYELSFSNVTLAVHFPAHLRYVSPLLHATSIPTADATVEADEVVEADQSAGVTAAADHVLVDIDSRKTVSDLKQQLLEQHASQLTALGIPTPFTASKLVISVLQSFGDGFYPLSVAEDAVPLGEALGSPAQGGRYAKVTHVLLWDGATLHGEPVLSGLQGYPKQLAVSLLSPGVHVLDEAQVKRGAADARSVPVQENKLFPSVYLPSSLSLLEFAHKVCDMCHVDRLHACVSVLCASSASTGKGEKTFVSTLLFKNGVLSGKALSCPSGGNNHANNGGAMMMTSASALGEFQELQYVVVEDAENRGLQGGSLVEALVARKNAEWVVTVELDFTPSPAVEEREERDQPEALASSEPVATSVQVCMSSALAVGKT